MRGEKVGIKKGTKLTDKPKNNMLRVRVDEETLDKLDTVCEETKKSRSEIIRNGIEEQYERVKK
ncbi:MAG: ribbon-helix-helix domain-containing protein [Oscillospiraceae bacterium]